MPSGYLGDLSGPSGYLGDLRVERVVKGSRLHVFRDHVLDLSEGLQCQSLPPLTQVRVFDFRICGSSML